MDADAIAYRNGYRDNSANCNCGVAGSYAYCYIDEHGNTCTAHGYIDASGNIYTYTHPAANCNGGANYPHRASGDGNTDIPASRWEWTDVLRRDLR